MREEMIQYSETHHLFSPGDKIIVGVSGGADSVCLLYLLNSLRKEMNLSLFVLHVKHGIRGDDADRDAQFVRELSDKWELPCFEVFEDVPAYAKKWGMSEEEAGRACRYEQFEKLRREKNADCIAVAHHKEDQAETFLFRLIRGSSARGLAAMLPKRDYTTASVCRKGRYSCVFGGEKDTVAGGYYESGYSVSEKLDSEGVTATVKRKLKSGCGKAYCGCGG